MGLALGGPVRQMAQLDPQNSSLQLIQPAVPAALGADVTARLPMVAERPQASGELLSCVTIIPASP